ncbi:MAG: discoidin domain-containing protein, partial [Spirochaetia bacterium]|nr:discoidin domain-containing protein [Spirochaetia bacterium]
MFKTNHLFPFILLSICSGFLAAQSPENLARGAKVKVSSVLLQNVGENLVDGGKNDGQKSRWVSANDDSQPFFELDFGSAKTFNQIIFTFYKMDFASSDFDLFIKRDGRWESFQQIRSNGLATRELVFPPVSGSGLKVVFLRGTRDNLVRLFEVEIFHDPNLVLVMEGIRGAENGVISASAKMTAEWKSIAAKPGKVDFHTEIIPLSGTGSRAVSDSSESLAESTAKIPLPIPKTYGRFLYVLSAADPAGSFRRVITNTFLHVPAAGEENRFSSAFGVHWAGVKAEAWKKLGIFWVRSHDTQAYYWDCIETEKGEVNWSPLDRELAATRNNALNPMLVLEGAPHSFSTAYEADRKEWGYLGYYPPSDLDAWFSHYVKPLVAKAQSNPGRVWEIWNETWSYFRWRGLYGTAAELFHFNRVNYDFLKKNDPGSLVVATDAKLVQQGDTWTSYKKGIEDLLDLGYLRFSDLANYHAYGFIEIDKIETIKNRLWNYGRDQQIWCTETGNVKGPQGLLTHMIRLRSYGVDRIFDYNPSGFADFFDASDAPTDELAAFSSLSRNLADGRYLGHLEKDGANWYFFAAKARLVSVVLSSGEVNLAIPLDSGKGGKILDIWGNEVPASGKVRVATNQPLFVFEPAPPIFAAALDAELKGRTSRFPEKSFQPLPPLNEGDPSAYFSGLEKFAQTLASRRTSLAADEDELKWGGEMLEVLDALSMLRARRNEASFPKADLNAVEKNLKAVEAAIFAKTRQSGALLNA